MNIQIVSGANEQKELNEDVFGYNPKERSKHAHLVNVAVAYTEPETGQVVIL